MSRQIDYNDPSSWTDEDMEWLRQRVDLVPAQHRQHLAIAPIAAPATEAESTEVDRLRAFLMANFADEMAASDDTPVGVAIRLLSEEFETVDPDESMDDGYDSYKVHELQNAVDERNREGANITPASGKKADLVAALRADDAAKL